MSKVAPLPYDDRTVYSVASFNQGVAQWLGRLPTLWGEGEVTELRRHQRWASVFFTLQDPPDGSCVGVPTPRGQTGAPLEIVDALRALCAQPGVDVIVLARGGGRFEDLLPFSDERLVRAVAGCPVPVVSAVGHEQDTPLCDLAADVRASTPTAAGKLVVPELTELFGKLDRARGALARNVRRSLDRDRQRLTRSSERLRARPRVALERESLRLEHTRERLRQAPGPAGEREPAGPPERAPERGPRVPLPTT